MTTTTSGSSESTTLYILAADNYLVPVQDGENVRFCTLVLWLYTKIIVHK